ncbi:MAG: right-handed parallel beta-helix repeat-containing protein [Candidatus Limnocylindrales bacterium]
MLRMLARAAWSGALLIAFALAGPGPLVAATPAPGDDCQGGLQGRIDAAPAGSTLHVPACVFHESVTVDKPLTIEASGAVIDGRDAAGAVVRDTWMVIEASDVTVSGFTMRYADNAAQTGALRMAAGVHNVTVRGCDLGYAAGADIALDGANQSTIADCDIHDGGQLGIHAGGGDGNGSGNVVRGNRIHGNNTANFDPEWEAGGMKATVQSGLVFEDNEVYDNHGPGFWCDIYCRDITVRDNRIHNNTHAGVMFEVGTGATISHNVVWQNGWGKAVWGWGAGILISSAGGAAVSGNILAWNATGISIISQDRQDWAHSATANEISDNTIVGEAGHYLLFWGQDWSGELFLKASGNGGTGDRFWAPVPDAGHPFAWDGDIDRLSDFNATPGEEGGRYLSAAEMASALEAAGVPTDPHATVRPATPFPGQARILAVLPWLAVAAAVLGLAAMVLGWAVWRRRRRRPVPAGPAMPTSGSSEGDRR